MSDVTSTTSRGPSRRAVVRTAAHAAWAVPAIQIAAAAPAFASSAVRDIINPIVNFTTSAQVNSVAQGMFVTNDGPGDLAPDTIELTLTIAGGPKGNEWASFDLAQAPLWTPYPAPGTGTTTRVLKFRYQGTVAKGNTQPLIGVIRAVQASQGGTKSATLAYVGPA